MAVKIPISTEEAERALKQLRRSLKDVGMSTKDTERAAERLQGRMNKRLGTEKAKQATDRLTSSLKLTQRELIAAKLKAGDLSGAMGIMAGKVKSVASAFIGLKSAVVGVFLGLAIRKGIKNFKEFEVALMDMVKVTDESLKSIRKKIEGLAPSLGSATQLVKGYYQTISAGVTDPAKAMETMVVTAQLAKVAHLEQAEVIRGLTTVLDTYAASNVTAAEAADFLLQVEAKGKTQVSEMIPVIGSLTSLSSTLGITLNELGGAFAQVTQFSGNTAEASTRLEGLMTALIKPTTELTKFLGQWGGAQEAIRKLGFVGLLKEMEKFTAGNAEALGDIIARKEGMLAFLSITGDGFEGVTKRVEEMTEASGKLKTSWDLYERSLSGIADAWENTVGNMFKDFGRELAPSVMKSMKGMTDWVQDNKSELIAAFKALGSAALGAVNIMGEVLAFYGRLTGIKDFKEFREDYLKQQEAEIRQLEATYDLLSRQQNIKDEDLKRLENEIKLKTDSLILLGVESVRNKEIKKEKEEQAIYEQDIAKVRKGLMEEEAARIEEIKKKEGERLEQVRNLKKLEESMAGGIVAEIRTLTPAQEIDEQIRQLKELQDKLHKEAVAFEKRENLEFIKMKKATNDITTKDRIEAEQAALAGISELEKEHVDEYQKIWDNFLESTQSNFADTFNDIFSGELDSFEKFIDRMKESFTRMLADMAAEATMKKLFGGEKGTGLFSNMLTGAQFMQGPSGQGMEWLGTLGAYGMAAYGGFQFGQMIGSWLGLGKEEKARYKFSKDWQATAAYVEGQYKAISNIKHHGKGKEITDAIRDMYKGYTEQANVFANIVGPQGTIAFKPSDYRFNFENAEQKLAELAEDWSNTLWDAFKESFEDLGFQTMEAVVKGITREQDALGNAFQGALESGSWLLFKSNIAEQIYNTISEDLTNQLIQSKAIQGALMPVYGQIETALASATAGGGFDIGLFRQGISGVGGMLSESFSELKPAFNEIADLGRYIKEMLVGTFQSGGVVPKTGLAMVHEGETITPEGSPPSVSVVVQGNVWGTDLQSIIIEALENANMNRIGRPLQRYDLQTAGIDVS